MHLIISFHLQIFTPKVRKEIKFQVKMTTLCRDTEVCKEVQTFEMSINQINYTTLV